ncbi:unnamed protein product [Merluccius merluccius]
MIARRHRRRVSSGIRGTSRLSGTPPVSVVSLNPERLALGRPLPRLSPPAPHSTRLSSDTVEEQLDSD